LSRLLGTVAAFATEARNLIHAVHDFFAEHVFGPNRHQHLRANLNRSQDTPADEINRARKAKWGNLIQLYQRCDQEQRRQLNQAIFHAIYIEDEQITDHELHEPFASLHAIHEAHQRAHGDKPDPGATT
jgi:hypothetical protein